jgi:hypothetical protein
MNSKLTYDFGVVGGRAEKVDDCISIERRKRR